MRAPAEKRPPLLEGGRCCNRRRGGNFVSFAVSLFVAGFFATAAVLAQVGGPAPSAPAPPQAKKAVAKPGVKPSPFDEPPGGAVTVERRLDPAAPKVFMGVAKKAVNRVAQPNRAPLIQQFTNQARPLLRAELIFARNVCHLNRDDLRKVNHDAQQMLDEVVTKLVDAQFQPRVKVQVKGPVVNNNLDAQQLLLDGVVAVMKRDLTADQWSLYEIERQKRDANRKRMTIRYFLDAIDREIYLSPGQRERLETTFNSNWESNWALYLENHLYGNRYYPMTIDALVTPILSDAQKKVWQGVQKVGAYWGFAGMLGGFTNDPDGLEIELGEPARKDQNQRQMIPVMKMQGAMREVIIRDEVVGGPIQKKDVRAVRRGGPKQVDGIPEKKPKKAKD
jgi:hypothetical protein